MLDGIFPIITVRENRRQIAASIDDSHYFNRVSANPIENDRWENHA